MKYIYLFAIGFFLLPTVDLYSQTPNIQIAKFDETLTYTEGESISVIINTPGIFPLNNVFTMELSDASGSFANPVQLASETEFFLPIMNGVIPVGTPAGTGYKIRITSNYDGNGDGIPDITPPETNAFAISVPVSTSLNFDISFTGTSTDFIDCTSNGFFGFLNNSSGDLTNFLYGQIASTNTNLDNTNFTANLYPYDIANKVIDIVNGIPISITLVSSSTIVFSLPNNLSTNFYVLEFVVNDNGKNSTKSYIYHFNTGNSGLSNLSSEEECVGNLVEFQISTSSMNQNYPGSKYTLDFGDGTLPLELTHAQIFGPQVDNVSGNKWSHTYSESTCDSPNQTLNSGNGNYYFQVQFELFNKGIISCNAYDENGNGTTKWVNISLPPVPDFTVNDICIQNDLVAMDNTTPGAYGFNQSCAIDYNVSWTVDPPNGPIFPVPGFTPGTSVDPLTNDLTLSSTYLQNDPSAGPGCYIITLIVSNPEGCTTPQQISKTVQVQAIPDPSFTFSPQSIICPGDTVSFISTSAISSYTCQVFGPYVWTVTPVPGTPATSSGYTFEIDPSLPSSISPENYENPDITFTQEGQYEVSFTITNSCGSITHTEIITVSGDPTVNFSPDTITICEDIDNLGYTIDFDTNFSPNYSAGAFAPTSFNWIVSGPGVTSADYSFVNGTTASDQYPVIHFNSYNTYIITVTVDGNCSISNQAVLTFEYKRAPKITNTDFDQVICSSETTTAIPLSSDLSGTTFEWTINVPLGITGETTTTTGPAIPAMTLVNSTNQPLDLVITVSPKKDGCSGIAVDFIFTVNPTPLIPNQNVLICSGETFSVSPQNNATPTTIVPVATTYTWTVIDNPNVTGGMDVNLPQNDISQQLTNQTNVPQTVLYTVTPTSGANGNCVGNDFTVEVTVGPKPIIPDVNMAICSGETFTVLPVNNAPTAIVPSNTTYTWTVVDNANVTGESDETVPQNNISQQLMNQTNVPQVVSYTVTPTSGVTGNCVGQSFMVTIVVNPTPVVPDQNVVICSGESFNVPLSNNPPVAILPSNTTYTWTVVDNPNVTGEIDEPNPQTDISQQLFNQTNVSQNVVYTVTPASGAVGNCVGQSFQVTIQVNPTPVNPNQNITICSGDSFIVSPMNNPPSAIVPNNTTYTWTVANNPNVTGDADETTPQTQISQQLTNNSTVQETVVYTVTPTSGNCIGNDFTLTVFVDPVSVIQDKTETICSGGTFTVIPTTDATSTVLPGTTYTWTVVDNPNVTGETDETTLQTQISQQLTNLTNTSQTVTYTVTPITLTCDGDTFVINVQVEPVPTIPNQNITVCSGENVNVTPVNNVPTSIVPTNTTYTWTVVDNPNITGDTDQTTAQSQISLQLTNISNIPQTVTYTVTPVSGACVGADFTIEITVDPIPVMDPIPSQTICSGTSFSSTVLTSDVVGTSFSWQLQNTSVPVTITGYQTSGTGILNGNVIQNTGTAPYVLHYEFTPAFGNCVGTMEIFDLTVNPSPSVQFDIPDQDICSGASSAVVNLSSTTPNVSFSWQINPVPSGLTGVTPTTGTITIPSFTLTNTTSNPIDLIIKAKAETLGAANCEGLESTYTITVYPEIVITTQPTPSQSICEGGTANALTVAYSGGTGNPSYQWYENTANSNTGGTIIPGATGASYTPPVFSSTGVYYFYAVVSLDGDGCGSVTSDVATVSVVADPNIDTQPLSQQTQCLNSIADVLQVVVSGGLGNTSYQWYVNSVNSTTGGTAISGATNTSYVPPTNTVGIFYYYVVVTQDVSGCETTSTLSELEVVSAPSFTQQPVGSVVCLNGDASDLSFSFVNGSGTTSYQWYSNTINSTTGGTPIPGATGPTYDPPTGTVGSLFYYVEIAFGGSGCSTIVSNPAEVEVTPMPTIDIQPTPNQSICEGGTASALTVSYLGGTGTPSYQWYENTVNSTTGGTAIPGANAASYTPPAFSSTGIFYYYATVSLDGEGCGSVASDVATINVVVDPVITTQPLLEQIQCVGSPADILQVSISGGLGNASFQWYVNSTNSTVGGTAVPGATNASYVPPTNTIGTFYYYMEVVQDVSGCQAVSATSKLEVVPIPSFDQQPSGSVVCLNGDAPDLTFSYIDGTGSVSYQWYSNTVNSTTGGTAIPGETGQTYDPPTGTTGSMFYYVEITFTDTGCGAVVSNPAEVIVIPYGNVNPVNDILVCHLSTIPTITFGTTDTSGNTIFQWTNSNPAIGLASSGVGDIPSFVAQNNSTSQISATISVTPVYSLGGTDCAGTPTNFTITVGGEIQASAVFSNHNGFGVSCYNSSDGSIDVTAQGGAPFSTAPFYQYSWSGPNGFTDNTKFIDNLVAGNYVLTITDSAGCSYDFTFQVTAPPEIIIQDDAVQDVLCNGEFNGNILVTPSGGSGSFDYVWLKNGAPVALTQDFQNIGPGLYTLIVTDSNGCTRTKDYTISEPSPIQISVAGLTSLLCFGDTDTGSIDIEISGGRPLETAPGVFEYTYQWTGPNGFTSTSQDIANVPAGIYTVTVFDNLGCEANLDIEITQPDPLTIIYDVTNESCLNVDDGSIAAQGQGGTPPYTYLWSTGATTSSITNLPPGFYDLLVTDANNCEASIQIQVEEAPEMEINAVVENISCFGFGNGSIKLVVTGGNPTSETPPSYEYTYYWQGPANFTSTQAIIENLVSGTYTVTVTDALGCEKTESYTIVEPSVLEVAFESTDVFCFGVNDGSIDLTVSGGTPPYSFLWSNDATTEDIGDLSPGIYEVSVSDASGCVVEKSIEIKPDYVMEVPPPTGNSPQEFCLENQPRIRDITVDGLEIIWYANADYSNELTMDYMLSDDEVLYAQNFDASTGCYSEELLKVEIIVHDTDFKVYNLITVDGNDMNSRLKVEGIERFPDNTMNIYNRYGKLVWKMNSYNNRDKAFRGMANQNGIVVDRGNYLPSGTYYYVLEYPNPCQQTVLKGFLQIDNKN
jgi:plastocyanin